MTTRQPASIEDLAQLREELRAAIREAHETLSDLRREMRDARTLVPLLTDDLFNAEVKRHVDELGRVTEEAMQATADRIVAKFDHLADTLLGQDKRSRRTRQASIPDLINRT